MLGAPGAHRESVLVRRRVTVCPGVTVGDGCVIGAGSVVTRDIPANSFAAGVPCRVIRPITEADSMKYRPDILADNTVPEPPPAADWFIVPRAKSPPCSECRMTGSIFRG